MLLSQLGLPYERVPTDIFAGDSQTDEYLARNPAGRTPLLEVDGGAIPESGAILLYLAEGTPFLPTDPIERAHVHAWMFFEQNLLEPNVGTARFWRLTGRDAERPEAFARHHEAGAAALATLERGLAGKDFLVGRAATPSPTAPSMPTRAWRTRRATTWLPTRASRAGSSASPRRPGAIDDLAPYPAAAHAGAGGRSAHDALREPRGEAEASPQLQGDGRRPPPLTR